MALRGPRSPAPNLLGSIKHQVLSPPGSRFAPPHVGPASGQYHQKPSRATLGSGSAFPMAPYEEVSVSGFEDFNRAVEQHKGKTIFAYFTGSKDAEGKSWCPDCVQGEAGVRGCCPKWQKARPRSWPESGVPGRGSLTPGDLQGFLSWDFASLSHLVPFSPVKCTPAPRVLSTIRPI